MNEHLLAGRPHKLGAIFDGKGTNFAVFSENAQKIELCLFSDDGKTEVRRVTLPERTGPVWHGYLPDLPAGALYGYRAYGQFAPEQGHRFNHHKLLQDPYTRELRGEWLRNSATLGFDQLAPSEDLTFDTRDSAPFVPKSVVRDGTVSPAPVKRPRHNRTEMLIYEAHVKGLTQEFPNIPEDIRGTYEALASEPVLDHLKSLGITAIELLPVHSFINDGFLLERDLVNYWGYNTVGFFAPEPRYMGPNGYASFRAMVDKFHDAGIEVILDVVYNHTAEGDQRGPTLNYRGLDNASYYRLLNGQQRYYINDTGCGNTLNVSHPYVLRMVLDSLRFWAEEMGVDGFRFDLATTLCREVHGFDPSGSFLDALRQDPILSELHLIAEPWDIGPGGYQLGQFPAEFGEWNDKFRDTVRRYWRGDDHSAQELGACLLGSAGQFDKGGRRAWSSINFLSSHDGFTLADVTRYNERHNLANKEQGRDGHHTNHSENCGVEGPSEDPTINARRHRRQLNMLATLFLSQGTPMLLAGDEIGNSQSGNNNAYCQDNATGWINWADTNETLLNFVRRLSAFRNDHMCVRQSRFLHGALRSVDGLKDVEWTGLDGDPLQWRDPGLSTLGITLRSSAEVADHELDGDMVFIAFNRDPIRTKISLPEGPEDHYWVRAIDTAAADVFEVCEINPDDVMVEGESVLAFVLVPNGREA
ncbi:MAG: glycogen debranching protein GlgX [Pseudoruegeria sp.]